MNVLITGGSGYLGNKLSKKFIENGHAVYNIDLVDSKQSNETYFKVNILDLKKLREIFKKKNFDLIIHNAAKVPISKLKGSFYDINVLGTENILTLVKEFNIKKLIYVSSSAVYGIPQKVPILEKDIRMPVEKYGLSKKIAEDKCIDLMEKKKILILRPRTILGENRMGIFSILFHWIFLNMKVPVLNDGKNKYQFVDIRDFVNATYASAYSDYVGSLNIGSDSFFSIRELLENLIINAGSTSKVKNIDQNYLIRIAQFFSKLNVIPLKKYHFEAYGKDIYFDTTLSKKILNWSPDFNNKESMLDSYKLYVKNDINGSSIHTKKINNLILKYGSYLI